MKKFNILSFLLFAFLINSSVLSAQECGDAGEINEDLVGDDIAQVYCPGGEVTFETDGTEEFPNSGNSIYAWYIVNVEDEEDIYAMPVIDGANFTGDLNAAIEGFEGDIVPSGSYAVYGWMAVFDDNGDILPDCFELTEDFISLTVLDSSDPDCEGIEPPDPECGEPGGIAEELIGEDNAQDYCPGGEINLGTDGSEVYVGTPNADSFYAWIFSDINGVLEPVAVPVGTPYSGDINTLLEDNDTDPLAAGTYVVTGFVLSFTEDGELDLECVIQTEDFIIINVLEEDDPICTGEVECVADYGSVTPPDNLTICDGETAVFELSGDESDGYTTIFVVTQGDDLTIMGLNYTDEIDFSDLSQSFGPPLGFGEYTVHALNYVDSDLPALQAALMDGATGVDVAQLIADGVVCADLDVDGTTLSYEACECLASYGSVAAPDDLIICEGDAAAFEVSNDENDGYTTIFVVTQGDDLTIVGLNYTNEIDFANLSQSFGPPLGFGDYTVHALNYVDSDLPALQAALMDGATGVDVAQLIADGEVCADLDVDGVTLTYDDCVPGVANDDLAANGFGFINVYPSPAIDIANVNFLSNDTELVTISLTDIAGKVVSQETMIAQEGENNVVLNTQALSNGVYLISIAKADAVITTKIMK